MPGRGAPEHEDSPESREDLLAEEARVDMQADEDEVAEILAARQKLERRRFIVRHSSTTIPFIVFASAAPAVGWMPDPWSTLGLIVSVLVFGSVMAWLALWKPRLRAAETPNAAADEVWKEMVEELDQRQAKTRQL